MIAPQLQAEPVAAPPVVVADRPLVSVLMPVRNEARFIRDLVGAVLRQDYPRDRFEVIVADGMSTDGTREILALLHAQDARLTVIDNPHRVVSAGLNAALAVSRGEVVIRVDGHSLVAPDFIRQNVALLDEHPEAWSVGGPIRHRATTTFGKAVAVAMSHPLGVGNALHRYPDYAGYCEGAAFPAIRRWVFDRIGTFDVRLVRNQDDEFNYRITHAGGKVYLSPRVQYSYFVRERPTQLFRQYFQYGFWRIPVIEKHRRPTTVRQTVPSLFYLLCGLLAIAGAVTGEPLVAAGLPGVYVFALFGAGAGAVRKHGVRVAARVPLAIATLHAAYGLGLGYGLWARFFRPNAWSNESRMAAISR
jgi:succinoglycan biosynthesis protein ExoA